MQGTSEILENAIEQLAKLPGTGRKSARRMALHLLKKQEGPVLELADSLVQLKKSITRCDNCGVISDEDPCSICTDVKREQSKLCVVEESQDVFLIEKTNEFRGVYHVLGGVISPLDNIGPDDVRIKELTQRVNDEDQPIDEIILALNPDSEGEATAYYINKLMKPFDDIKVTRIAYGIPMGSELEFIDEATLSRAFATRNTF